MKRTQLYLEESSWKLLQIRARQQGCSVSDLVRRAVREKYFAGGTGRQEILRSVVGLWKDRSDLPDTETYLRKLRRDGRLKRLVR
jgi:hypothetical protein